MGISGLLPLLKSIQRTTHVREWNGKTVGVDAYGWLHKATISCALDLALGNPTRKYVEYVLNRVRMLKHFGVMPYLVFDGDYLPSKAATETDRERKRNRYRAAGLELLKLGRTSQAHLELQKSIDVTPTMARHVIDACKGVGVRTIVAPYEADSQLYYLEKTGVIDGVVSEDSDLLVFGVKSLITKLDQYGGCIEVNRANFTSCKEVSLAGWSDAEFRMMCILSGCDYLDNIPKLGLKTAHRMIRKHKEIDRVLRAVQLEGKLTVPKGYLEAYRRAELTFMHQRVFCPEKNELVMCNEPKAPLDDESLIYIGPDLDADVACGVASGQLDPMTKQPILVAPAQLTRAQMWMGQRTTQQKSAAVASTPKPKTITAFFKTLTPAVRTPLQVKDINRAHPHSAPARSLSCLANIQFDTPSAPAPMKRPLPWTEAANEAAGTNKKPCLEPLQTPVPKGKGKAPEVPGQEEEEEEEVSPFFSERKRRNRPADTPSKLLKRQQNSLTTPSKPSPAQLSSPSSTTAQPPSSPAVTYETPYISTTSTTSDPHPLRKITAGWAAAYSFKPPASSSSNHSHSTPSRLSEIIAKQRAEAVGAKQRTSVTITTKKIHTPKTCLQRLGATAMARPRIGGVVHMQRRTVSMSAAVKPKPGRAYVKDEDSQSTDGGDGEWPEFVGMEGKWSQSQGSSQGSINDDGGGDMRGVFDKFTFGR